MLLHFWLKGHQKPWKKVGSLSLAKYLVRCEPGNFQFWLQCLITISTLVHSPLGHSTLAWWPFALVKNYHVKFHLTQTNHPFYKTSQQINTLYVVWWVLLRCNFVLKGSRLFYFIDFVNSECNIQNFLRRTKLPSSFFKEISKLFCDFCMDNLIHF